VSALLLTFMHGSVVLIFSFSAALGLETFGPARMNSCTALLCEKVTASSKALNLRASLSEWALKSDSKLRQEARTKRKTPVFRQI